MPGFDRPDLEGGGILLPNLLTHPWRLRGARRVLLAAAVLLALPAPASARYPECPPTARSRAVALAREARTLFDGGRHDDSLRKLAEARRLCPTARLDHAVGRVHQAAGRPAEALAAFRACAAEGDTSDRALCLPEVADLEAFLARGVLVVETDPATARVSVEGVPGDSPAGRLEVPAGRVQVRVQAPGRVPLQAVIDVPGGGEVWLVARLDPLPVATAVGMALPGAEPSGEPAAPREDVASRRARPSTVGHWIGVGVGVGLVLGSIGPFVQDAVDRRAARPASADYTGDRVRPTNLVVGGCLAGAGVVAIVTSLALWPAGSVAVAPLQGGAAVAVGGRW